MRGADGMRRKKMKERVSASIVVVGTRKVEY